jgi:hypothetical protein
LTGILTLIVARHGAKERLIAAGDQAGQATRVSRVGRCIAMEPTIPVSDGQALNAIPTICRETHALPPFMGRLGPFIGGVPKSG